jgi:hypothetical protein
MPVSLPIDDIIQNGIVFNLFRDLPMQDIRGTVRALFEALHTAQVDYLLVGGVALLSYVEGRNTQDVDLIVDPRQIPRLPWQVTIQDQDFGTANYRGLRVDLLLTTNRLFAYVRRREHTAVMFESLEVPCATREGLLLLKLYALPSLYRQGNLARAALYETDILMLLQGTTIDEEGLLTVLRRHLAPHDIDELRRIMRELRERKRLFS